MCHLRICQKFLESKLIAKAKCPPAVSTRLSVVEQRRKRDRAEMEPRTPNFQTMSQKRYLLFNIFSISTSLNSNPEELSRSLDPQLLMVVSEKAF